MCHFAFLRHIFYYIYLQYEEHFLVTKREGLKKYIGTKGGQ